MILEEDCGGGLWKRIRTVNMVKEEDCGGAEL
jgi:hypothetical protein